MLGNDELEKGKTVVSQREWVDKVKQTQFAKQDFNKLIMNFFLIEGRLIFAV